MSETPPPYTGKAGEVDEAGRQGPGVRHPGAAPAPALCAAAPAATVYYVTIWHSRALLIGVGALALLAVVGTVVGASGFPGAAPVEQLYAFGVIVDMVAVAIAISVMLVVEFRRRADPNRLGLPVNPRPSVFAIIALVMAVLTVLAWVVGGGPTQVIDLPRDCEPGTCTTRAGCSRRGSRGR